MFTSNLSQTTPNLVKSHLGVDLSNYNCHQLKDSPIYSNLARDELHYVIDATQKGLKPHTKVGLTRLKKKNALKQAKKKLLQQNNIETLNPQSPQNLCLKALRTEFREKLQGNQNPNSIQRIHNGISNRTFQHRRPNTLIKNEKTIKPKTPQIIKRKQNQRKRRNELIRLVKKYKMYLKPYFGLRLKGYGRCPMVSRQQVKDYLLTLGIQGIVYPVVVPAKKQSPGHYQVVNEMVDENVQIMPVMSLDKAPHLKEQDFPSLLR